MFVSSNVDKGFFPGLFRFHFLSPTILLAILVASMLVGWLGCFISLKQYLKH
jgi:ABC-type Mn2+/Zn2+ transport system permease subunit